MWGAANSPLWKMSVQACARGVNHIAPGVMAKPAGEDRLEYPTRPICVVQLVFLKKGQ